MNITDLIAQLLQQGQKVELPEIGTLDTVTRAPHHDPDSHTYYPATRNVIYSPNTTGDNNIVKIIAQHECVGEDVAQQMWINYTDALADKIQRTGEHQFGQLGTLTKTGIGYAFKMAEGVVIDAGNNSQAPIEGVKTYDHTGSEDPFAQFDVNEELISVVEKPKPEPQPEPQPEPEPAEEDLDAEDTASENTHLDEEWHDNLKKLEDLPKSKAALKAEAKAEKARIKAEAKAEKERAKLRKRAQKDHDSAERIAEEDRHAAARREAEEKRRAEEELRKAEEKAEENRLRAEKDAEAARLRAEKKAEEERIKAEKRAAALAAVAASQMGHNAGAATPSSPQPLKAQQEAQDELARQNALAQQRLQEAEKEAARQAKEAEKEAARQAKEAEKEAARQAKEAEKEAARQAKEAEKAEKEAARKAKEAEKEAARQAKAAKKEAKRKAKESKKESVALASTNSGENKKEKEEKKSRKGWLWLLLLLLLAAGVYFLLLKAKGHSTSTATTELVANSHHLGGAANSLTFNTDMLSYSDRQISRNSNRACTNMADYINDFLTERGYRNARVPMMDRVRQYADERMTQLMGDRFAVQRFIPYDDYLYNNAEPWLRTSYAGKVLNTVQGELMDFDILDDMLDQVIDEYGFQPDGATQPVAAAEPQPAQPAQPVAQQPQPAVKKATLPDDNPVYVYVEKESKQGFDIIAGFYLNKSTAARMTARLHELGCDAYIIEKNEMFYVSMGSAPTRTKAEALYNHIKSWYDGDIVIKQLD